jgi:hypothetical protein
MMKLQKIFCLLILVFSPLARAEEAAPAAVNTPAAHEEELRKSFQREYVYLVSQKEALKKQKAHMEQSFNQRVSSAKAQTNALQKELVRLSSENDENHEYLANLERRKKDLQKRGSSMESTYKKANKSLAEFDAGLHFEGAPAKVDVNAPEEMKFEDFDPIIARTSELLASSAKVESFPASFVDMNDKLVEGTVTRIGRSAAIGTIKNEHFVLGPNGEGLLKALEVSEAPNKPSLNLYVFESIHKMAKIKKMGGVVEKLADLSPILFLGMMLMMVFGLFLALVRV